MKHTTEEMNACADAVQDVSSSVVKAAGDAMMVHGNDPNGLAILAAGFAMAIDNINRDINPLFRRMMQEMLKNG